MSKFWKALDGKKTGIAAAYWGIVLPILPIIYDSGIPDNIEKATKVIGLVLTYLGLGHKAMKRIGKK